MTMTRTLTLNDLTIFNLLEDVRDHVDDFTHDKFGHNITMTASEFAELMAEMAQMAKSKAEAEAMKAERSKRT